MHELSIAEAVVGVVSRHADGRCVKRVQMRIGHLRQVVPSALEFAFALVIEGTPLQGAELAIEDVPVVVRCRSCATDTTIAEFPFQCGGCGAFDVQLVAGEELLVDALELEDEEDETRPSRRRQTRPATRQLGSPFLNGPLGDNDCAL